MNHLKSFNSHPTAPFDNQLSPNNGEGPFSFVASPVVKPEQLPSIASTGREPHRKSRGRKARRVWSHEEDVALQRIVDGHMFDENGNNHWAKIADKMNNKKAKCNHRTGKQCRDRWNNHLRANIKKGEWTKEEEHLIREMHKAFGTKWTCMAKLMKNRTDNDIKNKWYSMVRSEKKATAKLQGLENEQPTRHSQPTAYRHEYEEHRHDEGPTTNRYVIQSAAHGLLHWQEGTAIYEAVPHDETGAETSSNDLHLLSSTAVPDSALGWTFRQPYVPVFSEFQESHRKASDVQCQTELGNTNNATFASPGAFDSVFRRMPDSFDPNANLKIAAMEVDDQRKGFDVAMPLACGSTPQQAKKGDSTMPCHCGSTPDNSSENFMSAV